LTSVADETLVYLTFHTYSQLWLTPWGYTEVLPDDYDDLEALAIDAVTALTRVYGTQYDIGSSTNLLGNTLDNFNSISDGFLIMSFG